MPDVTITPTEDGPYMVSGPVVLTAPDGHVIEHPVVSAALCAVTHTTQSFSATPASCSKARGWSSTSTWG
jgi:hypothetical protein